MIINPNSLASLQAEWAGVIRMREHMRLLVVATFAWGALTSGPLAIVVYNLPLLLAFDVLRQVLLQARDDGLFACSGNQLGNLMDSAKVYLPWIDWGSLREGVKRRNEVAHDGKLFDSVQCFTDIANIEAQIVAWGVISPA